MQFKKGDVVEFTVGREQHTGTVVSALYDRSGKPMQPIAYHVICAGRCAFVSEMAMKKVEKTFAEAKEQEYHDEHYKRAVVQPIQVMEKLFTPEEFKGFLKGNIVKYRLRLGMKDDPTEELDKIKRYEQWLQEVEEGRHITL